jgi:hypothetical protein
MAVQDQLEIIRASGEIEFYSLDPALGVTNIGCHPQNEIVIDSLGVAPFHAMLDHRQKPFHLIALSSDSETRLDGQAVPPNAAREIGHWSTIEIDGHTLILLEAEAATSSPSPQPFQGPGRTGEGAAPPPQPLPERPAAPVPAQVGPKNAAPLLRPSPSLPGAQVIPGDRPSQAPPPGWTVGLAARPLDQPDGVILAEISEREWIVNVEQTATLQVTIVNGGPIVATFQVNIEGLDEDWVTILPPHINLNEGQRGVLTVAITAPRRPSSRAGVHHFAVVVTSPNHPGRVSRLGASLTLNPYYEFMLGELSPKQQSVSWFRQSGQVALPIANNGNDDAMFRLDGTDDERACSFEFRVPGQTVSLATQAEMRLSPDEAAVIPVNITPRSRRLVGLRKRTYSFTITTSLLETGQTPRMVLGRLKSAPLIGFWHVLLMIALLLSTIVFLFIPGTHPRLYSEDGQRVSATDSEVTLLYNASRFMRWGPAHLLNRINGAALNLTLERKNSGAPDNTYEVVEAGLTGPSGGVVVAPEFNTVYRLAVEDWLSLLFPMLARSSTYEVSVVPILPRIQVSPADTSVEAGQSVTLAWDVQYADRLVLKTKDGLVLETFDQPESTGTYEVTPEVDTVYIFEAYNLYTDASPETANAIVKVFVPPPLINFFIAQPNTIIDGTPVVLSWRVSGADTVSIESDDPLDRPIEVGPDGPAINRQPTRTTLYTLKASNGDATAVARQEVGVTPAPTPTGTPAPPEIVFFTAEPTELVRSSENLVELKWSVRGRTTNIEISGPSLSSPITNLQPEGAISVTADSTTLFVLAAFNSDQKDSQNVQVQVKEPTPTPEPTPTATPEPTPIPTPAITFRVDGKFPEPDTSPPVYKLRQGTDATLAWNVSDDAKSVVLKLNPGELSFSPGNGSFPLSSLSGKDSKQYQLEASNDGGTNRASLEIEVVANPVPPPPSNVWGDPGDKNVLHWEWNPTADITKDDIRGFRIYRGLQGSGSFDFTQDIFDPSQKDWTDASYGCGMIYYVVTLYQNLDLDVVETDASSNSWASEPCP